MKILHVNYSDNEGGAGKAARRLHELLLRRRVESRMVVLKKTLADRTIDAPLGKWGHATAVGRQTLSTKLLHSQRHDGATRSLNLLPSGLGNWINSCDADVVNLHWINAEAIGIDEIRRIKKPVVWTLHDMWPIEGLVHYPPLRERGADQADRLRLDARVRAAKKRLFEARPDIRLVSPSHWLADKAKESDLCHGALVNVVPNGLNQAVFKPIDKGAARQILNLPSDQAIVLFGAASSTSDERKGFRYLQEAFAQLAATWGDRILLLVFGASEGPELSDKIQTRYVGTFSDDIALSLLYGAADVFVAPSLQDNYPNTLLEAKACGTPRVAFRIGGMPELITHEVDGYLADPMDAIDLARGIDFVLRNRLSDTPNHKHIEDACFNGYLEIYQAVAGR